MSSHLGGRGLLCSGAGGSGHSFAGRPAALVQTAAARWLPLPAQEGTAARGDTEQQEAAE